MAMKKLVVVALLALSTAVGCAYSGVATRADGTVIVAKNDGFLFGFLRQVYACKPNGSGGLNCDAVGGP
jgi:hypothetical protein